MQCLLPTRGVKLWSHRHHWCPKVYWTLCNVWKVVLKSDSDRGWCPKPERCTNELSWHHNQVITIWQNRKKQKKKIVGLSSHAAPQSRNSEVNFALNGILKLHEWQFLRWFAGVFVLFLSKLQICINCTNELLNVSVAWQRENVSWPRKMARCSYKLNFTI